MENISQNPELDTLALKTSQAQLIVLIENRVHILLALGGSSDILLDLQNITQKMLHKSLLTTDSPEQVNVKKILCSLILEL